MALNPEKLTDDELTAQMASLFQERERRVGAHRLEAAQKAHALLCGLVSDEGGLSPLDLLAPEHTKPRYGEEECTDENLRGFWRVYEDGKEYRCTRCKVLYAASLDLEELAGSHVEITLDVDVQAPGRG